MSYHPLSIANYFIYKGGEDNVDVDHLKLQKLVYIAHGWCLAITGEPLISEAVRAWQYGPVITSLWREFKDYGSREIRSPARPEVFEAPSRKDARSRDILRTVWEKYGSLSGVQLSNLTHQAGTPWWSARKRGLSSNPKIRDKEIRLHFLELARQGQ